MTRAAVVAQAKAERRAQGGASAGVPEVGG